MDNSQDPFDDSSGSDADVSILPDFSALKPQKFLRVIGKAGVGKSTYILKNFGAEYMLTAYTGLAASRLGAKTISSIFKLGRGSDRSIDLPLKILYRSRDHIKMRELKGLVIDEFYTLPADVMLKVDEILRAIIRDERPFGGLDLILVGDDRQTKCIDENAFIDTQLYQKMVFSETILPAHADMRLKPIYMEYCDKFRNPKLSVEKIMKLLKDPRFAKSEVPGVYVFHENKHVDAMNLTEMNKFEGDVICVMDGIEYKKNCPILVLNNTKYCSNGMIGKLIEARTKTYLIDFDSNVACVSDEVKFAPAFSFTIHRSQCNTFAGINLYISIRQIEKKRAESIRLIYTALTRVSRFTKCFIGFL